MKLTDEQRRIVSHGSGHARVSAVAGSGKTTTMIARVGYLLEQGVPAGEQLILMFNKSARDAFAQSMEVKLVGMNVALPEVRTFHALGHRLVTSFTKRGVLPAYTLVTEEYILEKLAKQVAREVYKQESGREGWISQEEIEAFIGFIDQVKSTILEPHTVFAQLKQPEKYSYFIKSFILFEKVRKQRKMRFYSDLIYEPLMAMQNDPELVEWVAGRVGHIIVDEYQDINEAQQLLLKILAGSRAQVMVVGDVDQCIYEWRGARPEYIITRFQLDFPEPENYTLSYTFRYGHRLSLAANHLISNNILRDRKLCVSFPANKDTQLVNVAKEKRHPVVSILNEWCNEGRSLTDAVVLVRLYALSVPVELALLEAGISYRLEGNEQVFGCQEILALTGYLQLAVGTLGSGDFIKAIKSVMSMLVQPHLGLKREELALLAEQIAADPLQGAQILSNFCSADIPKFIQKRFDKAAENWRWIAALSADATADVIIKKIIDRLDLFDFYHSFSARASTAENRIKTCQAFVDFAAGQKLSIIDLLDKITDLMTSAGKSDRKSILITSVHRAKGLEWPLVIIPGLEDGSFPLVQEKGVDGVVLEDERRLFYVAMTRAVEKVIFIHPLDKQLTAKKKQGCTTQSIDRLKASRFLYEANLGLSDCLGGNLHQADKGGAGKYKAVNSKIANQYLKALGHDGKVQPVEEIEKESEKVAKTLKVGDIAEGLSVWHPKFGPGVVTTVKDRKQGRILVMFEDYGEMLLLANYAKLQSN